MSVTVIVGAGLVALIVALLVARELDIRRIARHRCEAWYLGFDSGRRVGPEGK